MEKQKKGKQGRFRINRILSYAAIVKQVPYFLFLALLAVVYIYNGHLADKTIRNITKTSTELKELQYEYKSVKGDALDRSKQSELIEAVQPLGLRELTTAPGIITDSVEKD